MGGGATAALAIVTAHTQVGVHAGPMQCPGHLVGDPAADAYAAADTAVGAGHSTVPAVAEELAEVGAVAAGVSHTPQHLLPWERAHALMPLEPLHPLPSGLSTSCCSPLPAFPCCVTCPSVAVNASDVGSGKELHAGAGAGGFKAVCSSRSGIRCTISR